ncbi:hypothetical protein B0H11DRAFT_1923118 [Mycena galericulata]|nr:hypothetical protein B0H11DRAFT_1923118 [Mycena galericulata]
MSSVRRNAAIAAAVPPAVDPRDFVDDMADESDDAPEGLVTDDIDVSSGLSDITESDLSDFIVSDGEQLPDAAPEASLAPSAFEASDIVPDISPPDVGSPLESLSPSVDLDMADLELKTPVKRRSKKRAPVVNDSDEEDLEAIGPTDSLFARPPGVKASLLPPPLDTRSSVNKRRLDSDSTLDSASASDVESSPTKRSKSDKETSRAIDLSVDGPPGPPTLDIEQYLARYMAAQGPLLAQSVVRELMPVLTVSIKESVAALTPLHPVGSSAGPSSSALVTPPKLVSSSRLRPSALPLTPGAPLMSTPKMSVDSPFSSLSKVTPRPALSPGSAKDVFGSAPAVSVPEATPPASHAQLDLTGMFPFVASSDSSIVDSAPVAPLTVDAPPPAPAGSSTVDTFPLAPAAPSVAEDLGVDLSGFGSFFDVKSTPPAPSDEATPAVDPTVFLADLENYKTKFAERYVFASYVPQNSGSEPSGNVSFSKWKDAIEHITRVTLTSAMIMTQDGAFINPARISPVQIETRPTSNGSTQRRLYVDGKVAICVSPGMCSESFLVRPHTGGGANGRKRKLIALTLHNQEWERWESFMLINPKKVNYFTMVYCLR